MKDVDPWLVVVLDIIQLIGLILFVIVASKGCAPFHITGLIG